mmetsp:Transcript_17064/g.29947  ORF Transcript_17064/g.29947 Transcript_17064/m.29947 type:complete len:259 (-) Transcript_17064:1008-1784(-)
MRDSTPSCTASSSCLAHALCSTAAARSPRRTACSPSSLCCSRVVATYCCSSAARSPALAARSGRCMLAPCGCIARISAAMFRRPSRSAHCDSSFSTMGSCACPSISAKAKASTTSWDLDKVLTALDDLETARWHIAARSGSPASECLPARTAETSSSLCRLAGSGGGRGAALLLLAVEADGSSASQPDLATRKALSRSLRSMYASTSLDDLPMPIRKGAISSTSLEALRVSRYSVQSSCQNWWLTAGAMQIALSQCPA